MQQTFKAAAVSTIGLIQMQQTLLPQGGIDYSLFGLQLTEHMPLNRISLTGRIKTADSF